MKKYFLFPAMLISVLGLAQDEGISSLRDKMKAEGLSVERIEQLLAEKQRFEISRQSSSVSFSAHIPVITSASVCDMGAESGWSSWLWRTGNNMGSNPPVFPNLPAPNPASALGGYGTTTGAGADKNGNFPHVCPGFGNHSIVLGDSCLANASVQELSFQFIVTQANSNFRFAYAAVVQDAGHGGNTQPYVSFYMYDQAGNEIPGACFADTGSAKMAGYSLVTGNGCASATQDHYRPWTKDSVDLSGFVGQIIKVAITNADCCFGAHFAYSYWDFYCEGATTGMHDGTLPPQSVNIFPSPASGFVFIDFGRNDFGQAQVSIQDVLGEEVGRINVSASEVSKLDVSELQNGVYFIRVNTDAGTTTQKLIISR